MSRLLYIRHAQASYMQENYDQLSELGFRQSRLLGKGLSSAGLLPDKIYIGPLKRHWQTFEMVREEYQEKGIALPEPIFMDELNEHQGPEVLASIFQDLVGTDPFARQLHQEATANPELHRKNHLRIFHYFMRLWAGGTLEIPHPPDFQNWTDFRQQVNTGIERILSEDEGGQNVLAFTSGGTVSAALGYALEIPNEERVVELNGMVKNTSVTEFLFSKGKIALKSFNEVPHLKERQLITYV